MKNAVIITGNRYPKGDAGAIRQHTMGKMLQDLGYSVMIYGMGESTSNDICEYDGIKYMSMRRTYNAFVFRIIDRMTYGIRAFQDSIHRFSDIDVFLVIDDNPILFKKIEKYGKEKKCCIIHDCVEWYSPEEFKLGKFNISYILKNIINKYIINNNWNIIAISQYIYNWFEKKAKNVILIPVIMEMDGAECITKKSNFPQKIIFVYAGAPGKKDYLNEIIEGFSQLDEIYINKIELHIIGITSEQLISVCGVDNNSVQRLGSALCVHGRVSHDEAVEWVKSADFTLLLRNPNLRYAKAGFPTKIVESLKYGTPPLCNISSDLDKYLNEDNSVIIHGYKAKDVTLALKKILELTSDEHKLMKFNARKTALNQFDYKKYIHVLSGLLNK